MPDGQGRRQPVVPNLRQPELARRLFERYRAKPRYRRLLAQRLRPRWDSLRDSPHLYPYVHVPREADHHPPYHIYSFDTVCRVYTRLRRKVAGEAQDEDTASARLICDGLGTYIFELARVVAEELRLTKDGQPLVWATAALHDDVRDEHTSFAPNEEAQPPTPFHGGLHLFIEQNQARIMSTVEQETFIEYALDEDFETVPAGVVTRIRRLLPEEMRPPLRTIGPHRSDYRPELTEPIPGVRYETRTQGGSAVGFAAWDELEQQAIAMLHEAIRQLRDQYWDAYPHANPTRLAEEETDLDELARFLFRGNTKAFLDREQRRKAKRLADSIGIDLPHNPR